ncbi:phage tail tube protein [Brenneria populi subsp. brevivirga]|uniref:phage tail tube protein n=1 Tax=Brenneria populi TaxID=1505588 RepID=UPI002E18BCFA|nr:phage tail tube protein [Brenneria populi subsp. brevivirga]
MADTSNRLAGTAYVTVDGVSIMVAGQFQYRPSGVERTSLTGMDGVHGYSEKPTVGFISIQVRDSGGAKVEDFNGMTNVTVTAELANGKTILGTGLWSVNTQDVESENATFTLRFEGGSVKEY